MLTKVPQSTEEDALTLALLQLISVDALRKIQLQATDQKQSLFEYLLQYQFISSDAFQKVCEKNFNLKLSTTTQIKGDIDHGIPFKIIQNNFFVPLSRQEKHLVIGIANPNDIALHKKLAFQTGLIIKIELMAYDILIQMHNNYVSQFIYRQTDKNNGFEKILSHQLLSDAIHRHASDVHIEPYKYYLRIRFRIDGLLHEVVRLPIELSDTIISCIKVLGHLDIAIKRLPQDGRLSFQTYLGFRKECRISTCPSAHNEKIVIRILDSNMQILPIEKLGLDSHNRKIILNEIEKPQGLILVTGPTGSGKQSRFTHY